MILNAYTEQKDTVNGITLISCGHIFAKNGREINRPNGRDDWLLFYVVNESETFYLNEVQTAKPGSFVLFKPNEKQHHIYKGNKTAEFYYIHFKCDGIPFKTSTVYDAPLNRTVCDLFEDIIEETIKKHHFYEKLCIYKLLNILTLLERAVLHDNHPDKENLERISRAVHSMNKEYNKNYSLKDYADMCSISKYHFLRTFEKIVGCTPIEYRNNIRMQHAVDLLSEEKLTITEISNLTGFSSPAYFSSAFRQKYGVAPKQFKIQKF